MAAYGTPLTGCGHDSTEPVETSRGRSRDTGRGWSIGPPLTQITASESVITEYDYGDQPDPAEDAPEPPEPTCPPWKFSEQRNKRHSHRRTNKKGKR